MKFSILASSLIFSSLWALDTNNSDYSVVLPTIEVEGISEQNTLKGYIAYDSADINRNLVLMVAIYIETVLETLAR